MGYLTRLTNHLPDVCLDRPLFGGAPARRLPLGDDLAQPLSVPARGFGEEVLLHLQSGSGQPLPFQATNGVMGRLFRSWYLGFGVVFKGNRRKTAILGVPRKIDTPKKITSQPANQPASWPAGRLLGHPNFT